MIKRKAVKRRAEPERMRGLLPVRDLKIIRRYILILLSGIILVSFSVNMDRSESKITNVSPYSWSDSIPPQPGEDRWLFVEELKEPMWIKHNWKKPRIRTGYTGISKGVMLKLDYPDTAGHLETAYEDLKSFLAAGDISTGGGDFVIETAYSNRFQGEAFRLEVYETGCRIMAGNAEGIRRGIFYLEDEMLKMDGPVLMVGITEKKPFIQRRISRCFFGPIKRPPRMRDELMDEVDYYPDQYLNRLAHDGVNGLWLTIEFRDLCKTSFTPGEGKDAARRLAKLKRTVDKCLRYGIRTYIFCIEPRAWDSNNPVLHNHPELGGARTGDRVCFCPMSATAERYLYESVNQIFRAVPGLGGIINITHGERPTTCLSTISSTSTGKIDCPRCADKKPYEVLAASLSAMQKGMLDAAPDAELISWLYMPQPQRYNTGDSYSLADWVYEIPSHTPEGVVLQFNFESGITRTEFGKLLVGGDYWISNPGPSSRFEKVAETAVKSKTPVSAKIQTGCSHEVASVPYVPVPSLLYKKFSEMHRMGVSHTMLCWYFGNYPGMENKVASELTFEPFPGTEDEFLKRLASIYWRKNDAGRMVEAWKHFSRGYSNYPLTNLFQYYGPMHDGPVWPLHLKPQDSPLSPTWQIGSSTTLQPWPPSGDRIGECLGDILTLAEVTELAGKMCSSWDRGLSLLEGMEAGYMMEPDRIMDIGVAKALGIQFRSGYNILHFYLLREKMFRMEGKERLKLLNQMNRIVREEIELDKKLLYLCRNDSRLGFHSEAEGYKYFPEKIRWRMNQLQGLLDNDFPETEKLIRSGADLYPEYTGKKPQGPCVDCIRVKGTDWQEKGSVKDMNLNWQNIKNKGQGSESKWAACYDDTAVYIVVSCLPNEAAVSNINVRIEPFRLWPCHRFVFDRGNNRTVGNYGQIRVISESGVNYSIAEIPFARMGKNINEPGPVRMNLRIYRQGEAPYSWLPEHPVTSRLILGSDNPEDLGWVLFR